MDLYLIFNRLSIAQIPPETTRFDARQWMHRFVEILRATSRQGLSLRSQHQLFDLALIEGYTIRQWLNDVEVDRESRQFFRSKVTKLPYLDDLPETQERLPLFDFTFEGQRAPDLGLAYLLESLAISLPTTPQWENVTLTIQMDELDADTADITHRDNIPVQHLSQPDHLLIHQSWIYERLTRAVRDGEYLWQHREAWFPHLGFSTKVEPQLREMTSGTPLLRQVAKRLFDLQSLSEQWTGGKPFPFDALSNASPESETVRNNPKLRRERLFVCPDGETRFFEWHLRLTPDAWRLYFLPDPTTHTVIIGYIGKHLSTADF